MLFKKTILICKDKYLYFKDKLSISTARLKISTAKKIARLIGEPDLVFEGIIEGFQNDLQGKTGNELLEELRIGYCTILNLNINNKKKEDRYRLIKEIIQKNPEINLSNFDDVKNIFIGFEEEFERAKFFVNIK